MHRHLTDVFARLDAARAELKAVIDAMPADLREKRPALGRWSASEIVHHLSLVDRRWMAQLAERIAEARAAGLGPERGARVPLPPEAEAILADRTKQRQAPEPVHPQPGIDLAAAWAAADRAREEFRATMTAADGLSLGEVTNTHAFFGVLTVYQWVELAAWHETRHAQQIREGTAQLQEGSASA